MFHGTKLSDHLGKRLHSLVWAKPSEDVSYLNNPIDDKHLEALVEMYAVSSPRDLSSPRTAARLAVHKVRQAFEKLGGAPEQEKVKIIKAAVDRVSEVLDSIREVPIERLTLIETSPRYDNLRNTDVDIVAFVSGLDKNEEKLQSLLQPAVNKIANGGQVVTRNNSMFFSIGSVDMCVSYTECFQLNASLQRQAVVQKMSQMNPTELSDEHQKAIYSVACCESMPIFYQRYLKTDDSEFYLNIARLVKLWKLTNLYDEPINVLALVLIAAKIAEHQVSICGDQTPSAVAVLQEFMERLLKPEELHVYFDSFSFENTTIPDMSILSRQLQMQQPVILDPTNFCYNLADTISDWAPIKRAAVAGLENIKNRRTLGSLFPPVTQRKAAKGA
jgi:2'-5'-oligoadenylate synthetase 1, domain 2, C-terminus